MNQKKELNHFLNNKIEEINIPNKGEVTPLKNEESNLQPVTEPVNEKKNSLLFMDEFIFN